jgi:Plastocyanin-like domain
MVKAFALLLTVCMMFAPAFAATRTINWVLYLNQFKRAIKNDIMLFKWSGHHDLWEFPNKAAFDTCNFSAAVEKCSDKVQQCSIKMGTVKTRYFGCKESDHCSKGKQKIAIKTVAP